MSGGWNPAHLAVLVRESVEDDGLTLAEMIRATRLEAAARRPSPELLDRMLALLETTARKRWAAQRKRRAA
jgi:hypothetical protein